MLKRKENEFSFLEGLTSAFDDLRSFSIDDFADYVHETLIKKIVATEQEQTLRFRSGEILFEYIDEKNFRVSYKCYFGEFGKDQLKLMKFYEDYKISLLKQRAIEELKSKGKIEFDITPPTSEERDKILREIKK